jgi:hypothetical protein
MVNRLSYHPAKNHADGEEKSGGVSDIKGNQAAEDRSGHETRNCPKSSSE